MTVGIRKRCRAALNAHAERLRERGDVTALHVVVGSSKEILFENRDDSIATDPIFDLASLSKPFTASLALRLHRSGALELGRRIGSIWPEAPDPLRRKSLSSLLRHRSGLPAWIPLYHLCRDPGTAPLEVLRAARVPAPLGTYSDLGFLLWAWSAERVSGRPLADLLDDHLLKPMSSTGPRAAPGALSEVATSLLDTSKEVELAAAQGWRVECQSAPDRGFVQDGNARFLGGVCGHAGLFGTAREVWRLAAEWLRPARALDGDSVRRALGGRGPFALGWSRRRLGNSGGPGLSRQAFGHVGFTGGSCWIDPDRDLVVIALAHRRSLSVDLLDWRRELHRIVTA